MSTSKNARKQAVYVIAAFAALGAALSLQAMYDVSDSGTWPTNWPKELEPLRAQSRSLRGDYQSIYELPFTNRAQFEAAWPHILTVKSPEAPIILFKSPGQRLGGILKAGVRILAPLTGELISPKGTHYPSSAEGVVTNVNLLRIGPPWPDNVKSKSGALPEFVAYDNGRWVPYCETNRSSNFPVHERPVMRARTELELIVDGDVVDWDRVRVPADTPVIDRRSERDESTGAIGSPTSGSTGEGGPEQRGTVRVQLVDSEGKVVAFAKGHSACVHIEDAMRSGLGSWKGTVTAAGDGTCEFKSVTPGKYLVSIRLLAAKEGPTTVPQEAVLLEVKAGQLADVRVELLHQP